MSSRQFTLPVEQAPAKVDPAELRKFASGAKDHRTDQDPYPWEGHDPNAVPKHNVSVRLNDHQLEMLRWLAQQADVSQQKILNRILIPILKERISEITQGPA